MCSPHTARMNLWYIWLVSACSCARISQAFVTSPKIRAVPRDRVRFQSYRTCDALPRFGPSRRRTTDRNGDTEGHTRRGLAMAMRGRPAPQLSEEELAAMSKAREEANRKVEAFLDEKRALKEAKRKEDEEVHRRKVVDRIKAEKEDAAHKKVYIPQRLQEIEQQQAALEDRVGVFNEKVKDKDIREI